MSVISKEIYEMWKKKEKNTIESISSHEDQIFCYAPDDMPYKDWSEMVVHVGRYVRMSILPEDMQQKINEIIEERKEKK